MSFTDDIATKLLSPPQGAVRMTQHHDLSYVLVWSLKRSDYTPDNGEVVDHWCVYETYNAALAEYNVLLQRDDLYSASITLPLDSTDYVTRTSNVELCAIVEQITQLKLAQRRQHTTL